MQHQPVHLFGDVYWQSNTATSVLIAVAATMLLTAPELWAKVVPGVMAWAWRTFPNGFEWVVLNWSSVGFIALGAGLAWAIRLNPDGVDEDDPNAPRQRSR